MNSLIIIPARLGSSRFPGKPLARINGISMIERVWRIAKAATSERTVIATDSAEIAKFTNGFGGETIMTSPDCRTGMDRACEVIQSFPEVEIILTLQGDAVLTPPWVIEAVLESIKADQNTSIVTPIVAMKDKALSEFLRMKESGSSTGTTVTFNKNREALYFSKGVLPYAREKSDLKLVYRHIGLYAYRRNVLEILGGLPQSHLEKIEQLEQLRALENGIPIKVLEVDYRGRTHGSVDNPEDIEVIEGILNKEGELF